MTFLKVLLVMIQVVSGLLLIVVILLQKSKEGGLGVSFGGNMGENLFGSRTGNILTKTTVILAIVFILNTFLLALVSTRSSSEQGSLIDRAGSVTPSAPARMPVSPGPMPQGSVVPADGSAPMVPAAGDAAIPAAGGSAAPDAANSGAAIPAPVEPAPVAMPTAPLPAPAPAQ